MNKRSLHTTLAMARKAGVSEPEELKSFVEKAGDKLLVVDVRNPDASAEPGDQKSIAVAALPSESFRPNAVNLIYDRTTSSMPLPDVDKDSFIITHCGTYSMMLSLVHNFHYLFLFTFFFPILNCQEEEAEGSWQRIFWLKMDLQMF